MTEQQSPDPNDYETFDDYLEATMKPLNRQMRMLKIKAMLVLVPLCIFMLFSFHSSSSTYEQIFIFFKDLETNTPSAYIAYQTESREANFTKEQHPFAHLQITNTSHEFALPSKRSQRRLTLAKLHSRESIQFSLIERNNETEKLHFWNLPEADPDYPVPDWAKDINDTMSFDMKDILDKSHRIGPPIDDKTREQLIELTTQLLIEKEYQTFANAIESRTPSTSSWNLKGVGKIILIIAGVVTAFIAWFFVSKNSHAENFGT